MIVHFSFFKLIKINLKKLKAVHIGSLFTSGKVYFQSNDRVLWPLIHRLWVINIGSRDHSLEPSIVHFDANDHLVLYKAVCIERSRTIMYSFSANLDDFGSKWMNNQLEIIGTDKCSKVWIKLTVEFNLWPPTRDGGERELTSREPSQEWAGTGN